MNPYLPESVQMNPPGSGVRPAMVPNNPNSVPVRPVMQTQPSERNISNQQNYQHPLQSLHHPQNQQMHPQQQQQFMYRNTMQPQQNNRFPNPPQQQQQQNFERPRPLIREDSAKFQMNPNQTPNPNQYNQSGGMSTDGGRPPHGQFSDPRQSIRPQLNHSNSNIHPNQALLSNQKRMEDPRTAGDRQPPNFQNGSPDNAPTPPRDHTTKVLSDKDAISYNTTNSYQRRSETTSDAPGVKSATPQNASKPDTDKKPDPINPESTLSSAPEVKPNQNNLIPKKDEDKNNSKNNHETKTNLDVKIKKTTEKENKNLRGEGITSGMVRKNIKYFEDNDTAKTPLVPVAATGKKNTKAKDVPSDIVKCEFHKDEYESGVDERPIVFPSLRTIFQMPRKVARISRRAVIKHRKKHKSDKTTKSKLPPKFLKTLHLIPGSEKSQRIRAFGSNEELLAFFESSKSWKKPYGKSGSGQNATKDKVAYKPTTNGDYTPKKTPSKLPAPTRANLPTSPSKSPLRSPGTPGAKSLPKTPDSTAPATPLIKKVPMNKIQVGAAPSPNLKVVKSKVGSLANTTHKPGGGNVKIETHKIDLTKAQPRIEAKNEQYKPSGGDKKIAQVKLQWSAKSKIGSLENSTHKPGGGDKKIETVKLDFKEKAKPKVGSKDNVKHVPGGGNVKIENQKLEFKAQSKVGSLDNVKHKPGGGDIKIFDDKTYLRQVSGSCSEGRGSGTQSYREHSTTREVEGRSAPATPGRKTTVKIKKITTFKSFEETPKVEKITEVTVTSKTLKDEKKIFESPIKQQVKLTYSKISSSKNNNHDNENSVEVVKVPASNYAPVLRPGLSKKEAADSPETERQSLGSKTIFHERNSTSGVDEQNKEFKKSSPLSPGLPDGKLNLADDSGKFKYLQSEEAKQERIGEIRREVNTVNYKPTVPNNRLQEEQSAFLLNNEKPKNNAPQLKPPNSEFQFAQAPQNSSKQYQPRQMSQHSGFSSSFQQEYTVSPLQLNQPSVNP